MRMLSTCPCPLESNCLTWAALSQPLSCFSLSTRDDVSSLWLWGATAPCFSPLDCFVLSWRPIHPGQLEPTTLPLRRLAPVSCSASLSPTLSLPFSLVLSCSLSPVAPLCSFPTVLCPLSLSFSLSLLPAQKKRGGFGSFGASLSPPGFEPSSTGQKRCGVSALCCGALGRGPCPSTLCYAAQRWGTCSSVRC